MGTRVPVSVGVHPSTEAADLPVWTCARIYLSASVCGCICTRVCLCGMYVSLWVCVCIC